MPDREFPGLERLFLFEKVHHLVNGHHRVGFDLAQARPGVNRAQQRRHVIDFDQSEDFALPTALHSPRFFTPAASSRPFGPLLDYGIPVPRFIAVDRHKKHRIYLPEFWFPDYIYRSGKEVVKRRSYFPDHHDAGLREGPEIESEGLDRDGDAPPAALGTPEDVARAGSFSLRTPRVGDRRRSRRRRRERHAVSAPRPETTILYGPQKGNSRPFDFLLGLGYKDPTPRTGVRDRLGRGRPLGRHSTEGGSKEGFMKRILVVLLFLAVLWPVAYGAGSRTRSRNSLFRTA